MAAAGAAACTSYVLHAASILSRGYFIGMQMMMLTQSFRFFFNYVRPRVLISIPGTITTYEGGKIQAP